MWTLRVTLSGLLLAAAGCQQSEVRPQTVPLPLDANEGTMFAVVDLGRDVPDLDRYGRLGDMDRLGGPTLDVEAARVFVAQFPRGSFNGVRGPELVYVRDSEVRDGLDAVRLPNPEKVFEVVEGALVPAEEPPGTYADLRVPCDASRAATRPSYDVDDDPRCPIYGAPVVVTCDRLSGMRWTARTGEREVQIGVTQEGCRVELTCAEDEACPAEFPMRAILPPQGAAAGEAALMELFPVEGGERCVRMEGEVPTFECGASTLTLTP